MTLGSWFSAALPPGLGDEAADFVRRLAEWSYWQENGFFLHTRWGVLLFVGAMPVVWAFLFLAPRRWWPFFLSGISLAFIALTLAPWPAGGLLMPGVSTGAIPADMSVPWLLRLVGGVIYAGLIVALLGGVYRLAQVAARRSRSCGSAVERGTCGPEPPKNKPSWRPLLGGVFMLIAAFFGLFELQRQWRGAGPEHAAGVGLFLPDFHEAGMAFLFVRSVHFLWDSCRGQIRNASWWRFLCWMTFFPNFRTGPIERYHDFFTQLRRCRRRIGWLDLFHGMRRIAQGSVKGLLAVFIGQRMWPALAADNQRLLEAGGLEALPYVRFWVTAWTAFLGAYWFLAGYSDIAIGLARLMGFRMIENFRWVFLSRNLTDLWHRAHISMSRCLRDYCYYPLVRRGPFRRRPLQSQGGVPTRRAELRQLLPPTVNYFITFMLCGLWHKPGVNWLIWGFCMGCGMLVNELWMWFWRRQARAKGPVYRALCRLGIAGGGPVGRLLGIVVTLNFFALTLFSMAGPASFVAIVGEIVRRPFTWLF